MKTSLYILLVLISNNFLFAQIADFKSVDFTRADNTAKLHKGFPISNLPLLVHKLTNKLPTKIEKLRAIYTWVCHNIKGDNTQFYTIDRKRKKLKTDSTAFMKWNEEYKKIAFKKLLKHKKTMCTGYAYLIKELCYLAGIESVIIDGYGRSVHANIKKLTLANHSWNAVKLNNKWYLCDATWSSGYSIQDNIFVTDYNDGYFLTDPVLFGKNHFPIQQKWALNQTLTATNFVNAPMVYAETFEHKIIPMSPQNMDITLRKNDEVQFRFKTTKKVLNKNIQLMYYLGSEEKILQIYNSKNEDGIITFNYKFRHKGKYDTHLKINNDIVATYTFRITKS